MSKCIFFCSLQAENLDAIKEAYCLLSLSILYLSFNKGFSQNKSSFVAFYQYFYTFKNSSILNIKYIDKYEKVNTGVQVEVNYKNENLLLVLNNDLQIPYSIQYNINIP